MNKIKYSWSYMLRENSNMARFDVYTNVFVCTFAVPLAWIILNFTNISANLVTLVSLLCGVAGAALGAFYGAQWVLAGVCLYLLLDLTDGKVASGRGGGTSLGTFLDMITDRVVLVSSVVSLSYLHLQREEGLEIFLLLLYVLLLFFMDILAYVNLVSTVKFNAEGLLGTNNALKDAEKPNNTMKNIFFDVRRWIPGRLSSYLFIIGGVAITGSFKTAYIIGIIVVVIEYVTWGVKRAVSVMKNVSS
ncbi:CDP-alcohol phosphatidyltransferase family protein [Verrucomicrobiota bacterium]